MIPEIDTQLAAVMKSLADNVLPALDPSNALAGEQIQLCLATLGLIRGNLPLHHAYLRRDLAAHAELAAIISTLAESSGFATDFLCAEIVQAEAQLADPTQGPAENEAQSRRLKTAIAALVNATRNSIAARAIATVILAAEAQTTLRARAWCAGMGFEPAPQLLPALSDLL